MLSFHRQNNNAYDDQNEKNNKSLGSIAKTDIKAVTAVVLLLKEEGDENKKDTGFHSQAHARHYQVDQTQNEGGSE